MSESHSPNKKECFAKETNPTQFKTYFLFLKLINSNLFLVDT